MPSVKRNCRMKSDPQNTVQLGLNNNRAQFALLMLINAFVGGMVGLERTVLPLIGRELFHLRSNLILASFVVSFGVVKAILNLISGPLAHKYGRKRILVVGWLFGIPVPFILMWASSWWWIIGANVLLGANQALAWSMTVNMKIDLAGPRQRGLAVGMNEFSGYFAVGLTALATGYLASVYGLRPVPFTLGIAWSVLGLVLSWLFVRETKHHVEVESQQQSLAEPADAPKFWNVFQKTSWQNRSLFAASQAGLVNNLNDGMAWVLFPLLFAAHGLRIEHIGVLKFLYPAVWGVSQILTGPLSDKIGRKRLIGPGMIVQALALWLVAAGNSFTVWALASVLLGIGTGMVYPSLIAAVSDHAAPVWRVQALGVYRFWRDMGYAVGALIAGLLADALGFAPSIVAVGAITFVSGIIVMRNMTDGKLSPER